MKSISSRDNPLFKRVWALSHSARDRRRIGQTVLDGPHLVASALDAQVVPVELVVSEQGVLRAEIRRLLDTCSDVPTYCLPDRLFAQLSPVDAPSGVIAVMALPPGSESTIGDGASVIVLDRVQDPGNLGTLLRTACAAGLEHAILTDGCAQAWSPRVLRAGMGAHFRLKIREQADALDLLTGYPGRILATAVGEDAHPLYDLDLRGPIAWMFGAEGAGLSAALMGAATDRVTIPMPGAIESLNVAAAAAVCLFEQVRQRRTTRA